MAKQLIDAIKSRKSRSELGYGILTADRYVKTVSDCVGSEMCDRLYSDAIKSLDELIKQASQKLTYSNPDMIVEVKQSGNFAAMLEKQGEDEELPEIPKNTLMVFRHVLTTPRKDRDGDILRTQGASVDPKMLLLWQHIHTLPIGKLLQVVEHSSKALRNVSAIIDLNELAHDSAVMMENGMGRFSHGFRALEWEQLKETETEPTGPPGFDIKSFEIMEESLVSVPSNVDAETEDILMTLHDRKTIKSDVMRRYVKNTVADHRDKGHAGVDVPDGAQLTLKFGGAEIDITRFGVEKDSCGCDKSSDTLPAAAGDDTVSAEEPVADKASEPDDVKRLEPGTIEGSYEWSERALRNHAGTFMNSAAAVSDMANRFVWIAGTFTDNAILCTEHERSMVPDEFLYWKAEWELKDGIPRFKGEPVAIQVNVTLEEQREASPYMVKEDGTKAEKAADEKVGRVLSRANVAKLTDVKEDISDLKEKENLSRGGNALCNRCIRSLDEVIAAGSGNGDDDEERHITADSVKQAVALMLAAEDRDLVAFKSSFEALLALAKRVERRDDFRNLLGN